MADITNAFKSAMAERRRLIGAFSVFSSTAVAESLALSGLDFVVIDMEHAPNDVPSVLGQLRSYVGSQTHPAVRIPWNEFVQIKRVLDIGVQTLMIPYIQSAEEAAAAVAATRYPPAGRRGVANMHRAARFGTVENYLQKANDQICILAQIETEKSVANLEEILAVDGIDAVMVGPADLSADMGLIGQPMHEDVQAHLKYIARRCAELGKPAGTVGPSVEIARSYLEYGFSYVMVGSDLAALLREFRSVTTALKA